MSAIFSRFLTHALLAVVVVVSGWLVMEWLLPGAITTTVPLYAVTAIALGGVLLAAPVLWRGSERVRWIGRVVALVPALALAWAFALNERSVFVLVGAGMATLLGGVVILSSEGAADSVE
jgi:peptidoglycan/LPS O-acetylase OafA/YrhL